MSVPTPILQYNLSDATMKGLLPAGYTPLVYIETTGTQLINTGVSINNNIKLIGKWGSLVWVSGGYNLLYGANSGANTLTAWCASSGYNWRWGGLAPSSLPVWNLTDINYTEQSKDGIRINGTLVSTYSGTPSFNNQTIYLFGDTGSSYYLTGRCYYFKIWDNNSLAVDLHPARRDSDGVIGMYDLVSRTFKTNSGSGAFIAGPPLAVGKGGGKSLPEEYLLIEYLESTGDLYINTTYTPQSNVTIKSECSLAITANLPDNAFWGSYNTSSGYRSYPLCICNNKPFYGNSTGNVGLDSGSVSLLTIGTFYTLCTENGPSSSNMKVNGTLIISQSSSNTIVNSVNYSMFARRHGTSGSDGNIQYKSKIKLQWLRHYEDGVIKFNFIPCYRKSDGKPGMYDTVNGVFYTNAGSGEFILGPSITNCYTYASNDVGENMWPETPGAYGNRGTLTKTSYGCYTIVGNSSGSYTRFDLLGFNYKPGPWTISFDAYATANTTVNIDICDRGGKTITITPAKQRFYVTATATDYYSPDRYYNGFFDIEGTITGTVYISNLCLMLGDRSTDYSPKNSNGLFNNVSCAYDSTRGWSGYFKASNQTGFLSIPQQPSLTNCTIAFWAKLDTNKSWLCLGSIDNSYYLGASSSGTGGFYHAKVGSSVTCYVDGAAKSAPYGDTNWHFYCFTGVNLSSWPIIYLNNYTGSNGESNDPYGWNINGCYQNFMIFDTALTAAQVKELYGK